MSKRSIRRVARERKRALSKALPQQCPHEACGKSLKDPSVPVRFAAYQHQFSLVMVDGDNYVCPFCFRTWARK